MLHPRKHLPFNDLAGIADKIVYQQFLAPITFEPPMNVNDFLNYISARGFSPNTIRAYRADLKQFETFLRLRNIRVTAVHPKLIQEYANRLALPSGDGQAPSAATVWRKLASISSYFEYLRVQSNGKINNPVDGVARPRLRRGVPKGIDEGELQRIISSISNVRDRAVVLLFVSSGLRLAELHQLNRDSITVERKQIPDGSTRVLGMGTVVGKGGKQRMFLLDAAALETLGEYLRTRHDNCAALFTSNRGLRLSCREIQYIFTKACERLGLPRLHIHQLRHSYAERLANAGIPSIVLKELMGHASFSTTQGYFRIKRQKLATEYFAAMELVTPVG
jgi:site-specific recombinase XerC